MRAREKGYPIVEGLIGVFGDYLKRLRETPGSNDRLDAGTFEDISRDLRLARGEFRNLIRLSSHSADELPKLLKVLGLDEADLIRSEPGVLRDMERVCSCAYAKRNVTTTSRPALQQEIMRTIIPMLRQYRHWARASPVVERDLLLSDRCRASSSP